MQRQTLAVSSCLLLLVGGAVVAWTLRDDSVRTPVSAAERTEPAPDVAPAAPAEAPTETRDHAAPITERNLADTATETPAAPAPATAQRHLHGTIVVVEADGRELGQVSGEIELELTLPLDENSFRIDRTRTEVRDGTWGAQVPAETQSLSVGAIRLDGRTAYCTESFELTADDTAIALRAAWLAALRLRVLGDDTGADLTGIRVWQQSDWTYERWQHPGDQRYEEVVADGRSPLLLEQTEHRKTVRYWVMAPGYAWSRIEMVAAEPGERAVRLQPGGSVEVAILGDLPEGGGTLRVRQAATPEVAGTVVQAPPRSTPITEFAVKKSGVRRIDALPAGRWSLAVEKGEWYREPLVVGHTEVVVTANATSTAAIVLRADDAARPAAVAVQGTLTLSPRWGESVSLTLSPSESLRSWTDDHIHMRLRDMTPIGNDRHRWGPKKVLAGRWLVLVSGTEHRAIVEVGPGLPNELHIEVPEPNDVRVRLLDAIDDTLIPGAVPNWFSTIEGWDGGWGHVSMEPLADGWYHALAPVGKITINAHPEGYLWYHEEHEVRPGTNEFVVRVGRVCGIEIVLRHDGVAVPWPDSAWATMTHATTGAGAAYWSGNRIAAQEPGDHTLVMPDLPGFAPIGSRTVRIEPAQWTTVEIELQSKK